jgi:transaldolase
MRRIINFYKETMMPAGYFHRVNEETPTRFWINNPSLKEMELALTAGAINCTTNPAYCSKLIKSEPDYIHQVIDRAIRETGDTELAAERVYQEATARVINRFLPLYEQSGGTCGFVTIQDDPRRDEDADCIIEAALRHRTLGPNFMTKIPVTQAGLQAMEYLIAEDMPICATEVFALDQATQICEVYQRTAAKTGNRPPFYVTHITGIFDEYLAKLVAREGIDIEPEVLAWAGSAVARKQYHLLKERGYPGTLLGGGARNIQHFTEFVGGDFHITINWSTAQELIEADEPAISRIDVETPAAVVSELSEKLADFRKAHFEQMLPVEEFADYGPVQFFKNNFLAGYNHLLTEVTARRQA